MASQFPSVNSQQRAGQFNKVPLKPGRSLVNWIHLTKSGRDLRKAGGSFLSVTPEELSKHNKPNDAWMSIRGMVYNVSDYMEYHPGGVDELMKGVGKDATALFDEVHRWVNYQNMLRECLIGKMVPSQKMNVETTTSKLNASLSPTSSFLSPNSPNVSALPSLKKRSNFVKILPTQSSNSVPVITVSPEQSSTKTEKPTWFDSYETEKNAVMVIYTKDTTVSVKNVICNILNLNKVVMNVTSGAKAMCVRLQLPFSVTNHIDVKIGGNGKIEVLFFKISSSKGSNTVFKPLDMHGEIINIEDEEKLSFRSCVLKSFQQITHDSSFYTFLLPLHSHMHVPIGCHVNFKFNITETNVLRPYTPVLNSFEKNSNLSRDMHFIIKHYDNGTITPLIRSLKVGDKCEISNYSGNTRIESILKAEGGGSVVVLAAGTGITPMVKLLQFLLHEKQDMKVVLLFFNRTEEDILWHEKLDGLCKNFPEYFVYQNILSQPGGSWKGHKGRISQDLIDDIYSDYDLSPSLCFVCGPIRFTQLAKEIFSSKSQKLFIFS